MIELSDALRADQDGRDAFVPQAEGERHLGRVKAVASSHLDEALRQVEGLAQEAAG